MLYLLPLYCVVDDSKQLTARSFTAFLAAALPESRHYIPQRPLVRCRRVNARHECCATFVEQPVTPILGESEAPFLGDAVRLKFGERALYRRGVSLPEQFRDELTLTAQGTMSAHSRGGLDGVSQPLVERQLIEVGRRERDQFLAE